MEDPIAGDGEGIPSQAGDGEGIPSPAMGSAGPPAAAACDTKDCKASCSDSMSSCTEWTSTNLSTMKSRARLGRANYTQVFFATEGSLDFADQDGTDGKPTEFLPDEHRKYDAKVRGTQAAVQRDAFEPFLLPRLGSTCCCRFT